MENRKYYVKEVNKNKVIISYKNTKEQEEFKNSMEEFFSNLDENIFEKMKIKNIVILLDITISESKEDRNKIFETYIQDAFFNLDKFYKKSNENYMIALCDSKCTPALNIVFLKDKNKEDITFMPFSDKNILYSFEDIVKYEIIKYNSININEDDRNKIKYTTTRDYLINYKDIDPFCVHHVKSIVRNVYFYNDCDSIKDRDIFNRYIKDNINNITKDFYPTVLKDSRNDFVFIYHINKDNIFDILYTLMNIIYQERYYLLVSKFYNHKNSLHVYFIIDDKESFKMNIEKLNYVSARLFYKENIKCFNSIDDLIKNRIISIYPQMDTNNDINILVDFDY